MRTWLVVLLLVLCGTGIVFAALAAADQTNDGVSQATKIATRGPDLKSPSATEYLAAVPHIVARWKEERAVDAGYIYYSELNDAIEAEVTWRFPQLFLENSAQIAQAYQALSDYRFLDRGWWHQQIIMALLREYEVDLGSSDHFQLGEYELSVTPRDFNADGIDEWLIWVESETHRQYIVVKQNSDGAYQLIDTPLPWFAPGYDWGSTPSGGLESLLFEDINADGVPEWVVAFGGIGDNGTNAGSLNVLTWRDGALVQIVPRDRNGRGLHYFALTIGGAPIIRPDVQWTFPNLDADAALEIQQTQEFTDNWSCTFYEIRQFDWQAEEKRYVFGQDNVELQDSFGCSLRQAQAAIWEHDLPTAIQLYERSLRQARDTSRQDDLTQYAQLRLVLAHSLHGEYERAEAWLEDLRQQKPQSALMETFITALAGINADQPLGLCAAAYHNAAYTRPLLTTEIGYLGTTESIVLGPFFEGYPRPNATKAGCDLRWALESYFSRYPLSTDRSPVNQLIALGMVPVDPMPFDLNLDGRQEWLVWVDVKIPPLYFAPVESYYEVSYPDMRMLNEWSYVATTDLPGETGMALVNRFKQAMITDGRGLTEDAFLWPPSYQCYPRPQFNDMDRYNTQGGYFRMWRLDHQGHLQPIADFSLCDERPLDQFFPNGPDELYGWAPITSEYGDLPRFAPAIYRWNTEARNFQPPPAEAIEADLHLPPPQAESEPATDPAFYVWLHWNDNLEWATTIDLFETALSDPNSAISPQMIFRTRYWYGLVLERAGEPNRALEQYAAIYAAAPDSAWGLLSRLHLTTEK